MKNNLISFCSRRLGLMVLSMILATALFAQDTTEQVNPLTKNDPTQYSKPYVILISADGFRADFAEKYDASFLQTISKNGVRAKYMQPSYPSVTFPNHYTIVTGLYPSHHGLVDRKSVV
jgi:predicted AlkP superfamily pyrophosphatase or phosphodiesterase